MLGTHPSIDISEATHSAGLQVGQSLLNHSQFLIALIQRTKRGLQNFVLG